jgi:hypothetical protein
MTAVIAVFLGSMTYVWMDVWHLPGQVIASSQRIPHITAWPQTAHPGIPQPVASAQRASIIIHQFKLKLVCVILFHGNPLTFLEL